MSGQVPIEVAQKVDGCYAQRLHVAKVPVRVFVCVCVCVGVCVCVCVSVCVCVCVYCFTNVFIHVNPPPSSQLLLIPPHF